ncbi:aldehyde ferredoxin oxidoreductase family protein [Spirochaetota bacterium]
MARGYAGKLLFVDLSKGEINEEVLSEELCEKYIGGYGIGAKILYDRMKPGVDPLGPENILGIVTSPLTGTPAPATARFGVMCKSPITGGWGDANCGGFFGPYLKFAGFDGIFVSGISEKPVKIIVEKGAARIEDASDLWGKDTVESEDILKEKYGKKSSPFIIGPAGEQLSLLSGIVTNKGSVAARSGVGAVMGSKKLKAIVAVSGEEKVDMADEAEAKKLRKEFVNDLKQIKLVGMDYIELYHKFGTSGAMLMLMQRGSAPMKNWGGSVADFPDFMGLSHEKAVENMEKTEGCWHCPVSCKGVMKKGNKYKYDAGTKRPEYESIASFGSMCLNSDMESIIMANDLCNRAGLDTISAGAAIAFAIECYENGILTKDDTGGLELTWGNAEAVVEVTRQMCNNEGFGAILSNGVKPASEKIGKGSEKYAIHIGGQEPGMHDPKVKHPDGDRVSAIRFLMDATPGKHNQGFGPDAFIVQLTNAACYCIQGGYWWFEDKSKYMAGFLKAVTGFDRSLDDLYHISERIATLRHAFNLREGINPLKDWDLPGRMIGTGDDVQKAGPHEGVTVDMPAMIERNFKALDWDMDTTVPSKERLINLGLEDVAKDLWPE